MSSSREKAMLNKKLQEEAQSRLPPNSLYIALYIRSDPPQPNDFHWAFYLHHGRGGTKHDVEHIGGGWMPNHSPAGGVFKTNFLCVFVHVADIPEEEVDAVEGIMRERNIDVNEIPEVTCRVWLFVILHRLIEDGFVKGAGVAAGGGWDAVQQECLAHANGFMDEAARNVQPRPVVKSKVCFDDHT